MSLSVPAGHRRSSALKSVVMLATVALVGSAVGADKAPDTDNGLQEVVVTAQFRAQSLQDTPVSITAVYAATMEERGQSSLRDLTQQAPNVSPVETGGAFGPGMTASIRGIGQADFDPARPDGAGWEASVVGSNLTDKLWYYSNFDLYASLGAVYGMPSAPRTRSGLSSRSGSEARSGHVSPRVV